MGTNGHNGLQSADPSALSENLSRTDFQQACDALARCAVALTSLASAIGQGGFAPTSKISALSQPPPVTVIEAVNDFLHAKARAGRSDRYLRALRVSLGSFVRGRSQVALSDVTLSDLETWLDGQNWAPRTKRGYLSDVSTLYNFCERRGLVTANPAKGVELPVTVPGVVTIHTPSQVRHVLKFARSYDVNLCRCLAVRYFAGLRSAEADRLREPQITLTALGPPAAAMDGHIEVTAANSKTRRRRLVTIQPALRAWLALGGSLAFGDRGNRWRLFVAALKRRTGIEWEHNVTRHSFASYHLAAFRDAAGTALEAGHTEQMLFAHYREVVTAEAATEFWGIRPD